MNAWVKRFNQVGVANVSDAMGSFGALSSAINAVVPGARVAGPAYTVRCYAGSIITLHKALLHAPAGSVLIVDAGGEMEGAVMGELMATDCMANGIAGAVIDGAVRDLVGLREMGFPIWARAATPRVATNRRIGQLNVPIACGGAPVSPGDWVVGDDDGVVIIPQAEVEAILKAAEAKHAHEEEVAKRLRQGERIADVLDLRSKMEG